MKYLFLLGRNIELSKQEIFAYLENTQNQIINYELKKNALLIDLENYLDKKIIEKFGGVLAIGKILSSGNIEQIKKELDSKEIYFGVKNKFNYVLWDFSKDAGNISDYLKKRFKKEKLKTTEKKIGGLMNLQNGEKVKNLSSNKLIDVEYFLFKGETQNYFGKFVERCDYDSIEKRDMNKPVRREELSISPRLAKIMINLSQVKQNEKLVDAFCGIGVVLQEALLQKIKVIGIDKDKDAIAGAKKNLEWFNFPKKEYKILKNDSTKIEIDSVNVLVSEPDLGDILKKIPTKEKAKETQKNFEYLMIKVINNLKKNISGRIVFSAPLIRIGKKRISCNIERILEKTNKELVEGFPISDFRKNQIVGRDIFVLE